MSYSRFNCLCKVAKTLFSCDEDEAVDICCSTRIGKLTRAKNKAALSKSLANNAETLIIELRKTKQYKDLASNVAEKDIFDAAYNVNKALYECQKKCEEDLRVNGYKKNAVKQSELNRFRQKLKRQNKERLIRQYQQMLLEKNSLDSVRLLKKD